MPGQITTNPYKDSVVGAGNRKLAAPATTFPSAAAGIRLEKARESAEIRDQAAQDQRAAKPR